MGLARVASLGRDGADTVALRSCFRFQPLSFARQCRRYGFSVDRWDWLYHMGASGSAAILGIHWIRAGAFDAPASNQSMKPTPPLAMRLRRNATFCFKWRGDLSLSR